MKTVSAVRRAACIVGFATLAAPGAAQASYSKVYDANSAVIAPDPVSPEGGAWQLTGVTPASPVKAAGSDATGNFWQVTDTNTNPTTGAAQNNSAGYAINVSGTGSDPNLAGAFTDPAGWAMSATMR